LRRYDLIILLCGLVLSMSIFSNFDMHAQALEASAGPFNCASDPGVIICQVAIDSISVTDAKLNHGGCVSPLETFSIYKNELKSVGREIGEFKDFRGAYKMGDKFAIYVSNCRVSELTLTAGQEDFSVKFK